jgi:hypothetical protein
MKTNPTNVVATLPGRANASNDPGDRIDRLFQRLNLVYGAQWPRTWAGLPMDLVKAEWRSALAFATDEHMCMAFDHCKTHNPHPPNCAEFALLCRESRGPPSAFPPALPNFSKAQIAPAVQAELDKLKATWSRNMREDPKAWARRILAEAEQGTYRDPNGIDRAKRALGVK